MKNVHARQVVWRPASRSWALLSFALLCVCDVRLAAAPPAATAGVIRMLASADQSERGAAIDYLSDLTNPTPEAVAALIGMLDHDDMETRSRAAEALQRIGARPGKPPSRRGRGVPSD